MYYTENGDLMHLPFVHWTRTTKDTHPFVIVPSETSTDEEVKKDLLVDLLKMLDLLYPERLVFRYYPVVKNLGAGLYSDEIAIAIESCSNSYETHHIVSCLIDAMSGKDRLYRIIDACCLLKAYRENPDFICLLSIPEESVGTKVDRESKARNENPLYMEDYLTYLEKEHPEITMEKLWEMVDDTSCINARELADYYYRTKIMLKPDSRMKALDTFYKDGDQDTLFKMKYLAAQSMMDYTVILKDALRDALHAYINGKDRYKQSSIEWWYETDSY